MPNDIVRIRKKLVRPRKTKPKTVSTSEKQKESARLEPNMSPKSKKRQDDSVFKPPVPIPVSFLSVQTMNMDIFSILNFKFNYKF